MDHTYDRLDSTTDSTIITGASDVRVPGPTSIGRYVVLGELASGGQANVFRVVDPELGRSLVLKLARTKSNEGDGHRDALVAEGRILAGLDHPNLVRIFDVGFHNSRPYLVLEHVSGLNLQQAFGEQRPGVPEAIRLIATVADVAAYAHRRGIAHGDIGPKNILIDRDGHPRLIDFGMSKIKDAWGEAAGPVGGTPGFLAPEIVSAASEPQHGGPAADVFGLAATLYWLLTGQAPFAAPTMIESLRRAQQCDIDFGPLQQTRVPRSVLRICRQALVADPKARPSASHFEEVLSRGSRPWFRPRFAALILTMTLIGSGLLIWEMEASEMTTIENATMVQSVPTINVFHHRGIRTLSNELPLQTGDHFAVSCNVSPGHAAILLWFNAAGELKIYLPVRKAAGTVDKLIFPAPPRSLELGASEGVEMVFVCLNGEISEEEARACFPIGKRLEQLPARNWVVLHRSNVRAEGPLEPEISDAIVNIEAAMTEIDRHLRQHFAGVTGIAFPHDAAKRTNE
jgi:serine/threonine protein kinase